MTKKKPSRAQRARSIPRLTNKYIVWVDGKQYGPFKITQLWKQYRAGRVCDWDRYWTQGLTELKPIPALSSGFPEPAVRTDGTAVVSARKRRSYPVRERSSYTPGACQLCHGPVFIPYSRCSGRGRCDKPYCSQCLAEMIEHLGRFRGGCPICGCGMVRKK